MIPFVSTPLQRWTVGRFLMAVAVGNLAWEVAHVPLYSLWLTGSWGEIGYAVVHCTVGDMMIATVCLGVSLVLFGRSGWPIQNYRTVATSTILLALGYTVFSEWLNTAVRGSWAYRDVMPRLPFLGTGLTPVLQWIVVPSLAFRWAAGKGANA